MVVHNTFAKGTKAFFLAMASCTYDSATTCLTLTGFSVRVVLGRCSSSRKHHQRSQHCTGRLLPASSFGDCQCVDEDLLLSSADVLQRSPKIEPGHHEIGDPSDLLGQATPGFKNGVDCGEKKNHNYGLSKS